CARGYDVYYFDYW
nr:immunoglobulin heavy chain junction region [Mus musculus]MBK4186846.1 immunoglobulin heavy chain junction region [Mus musculus]MBK4186847.1 immunoglobulin heavy chain junction region [Mus musculus]MBK4196183.1 immunoglobulin heavy chain junction region [Mus musculus]